MTQTLATPHRTKTILTIVHAILTNPDNAQLGLTRDDVMEAANRAYDAATSIDALTRATAEALS